MPVPHHIRVIAGLVTFAATAAAGWFAAAHRQPAESASRMTTIIAESATAHRARVTVPVFREKSAAESAFAFEQSLTAALDPDSAGPFSGERLAELSSLSPPLAKSPAHTYAKRWAERDPQGMFDWFFQRRGGRFNLSPNTPGSGPSFVEPLFEAWAKKDPDAAIRAMKRCPLKRDRAAAAVSVMRSLRRTDNARALQVIVEYLPELARQRTTPFPFDDTNYKQNLAFLYALPPGKDRGAVIAGYLRNVVVINRDGAKFWQEAPEDVRREIVASGFSDTLRFGEWGTTLPNISDMQRTHVEQTGDQNVATRFLHDGGRAWAQRDPSAAVAWALQHLKGLQRVTGTAQLFSAGAQQNYAATLQVWQSLPEGTLRARAAGHLAAGAPAEHQTEAEALINSLSPSDRQIALTARKEAETTFDFHSTRGP